MDGIDNTNSRYMPDWTNVFCPVTKTVNQPPSIAEHIFLPFLPEEDVILILTPILSVCPHKSTIAARNAARDHN